MRRLPLSCLLALACALSGGAPALAAAPLPPVSAFFDTPHLSNVRLSPQGSMVAMAARMDDGSLSIEVRETANPAKGIQLTHVDGVNVGIADIHWINEKRLGYTLKNLSKNSATLLDEFAVDVDGGDRRHLISGNWNHQKDAPLGSHISSRTLSAGHVFVDSLHDGSDDILVVKFIWKGADIMSESSRLYRLNTRTQRLTSAFEGSQPPAIDDWMTDNDGIPRIVTSTVQGRCTTYYRKPDDKAWTDIDSGKCLEGGKRFKPLFFDGSDSLYVDAGHNGYGALYRYNLTTMKMDQEPVVETPGFDFHGKPIIDFDSKRMLGLYLTTDANTTVWFNAALKADQARIDAALPGINRISCAAQCLASPILLVRRETDRIPADYVLYTRATGKMVGLGSTHPDIKPVQMGERSFYRYKARDGREIPVYVTLPAEKADAPRPAVVLVHGGPMVRGGSWEWDDEAAFLASRGYVVIQPEFRGGDGFGSAHLQAGLRQWGGAMQDDLADAAQWAVKQGWVDPARIGIMGASYGGYATLMGLIKDPQLFRVGVAWAGVTDLDLMFTSAMSDATTENLGYSMRTMIGDPDTDAALFRTNSPLQRAAEVKQPLLLAHGVDDRRVPLEHASKFYRAVKSHNRKVEFITYDDEGHGWRKQETRLDFWKRVDAFLDTNLKQAR
jgi:dipeptidyl aminopeptidase/acylaminoacyl peptidase